MASAALPVWVQDLLPAQREQVRQDDSYAYILAQQVNQTPLLRAQVLEELAPGFGDVLSALTERPDLLQELRDRLVPKTRLCPPTNCNCSGFGGV